MVKINNKRCIYGWIHWFLLTAVILVVLSKTVWVDIFGFKDAIFPWTHPALFSVSAAFIAIWFFSITDSSARAEEDKSGFEAQKLELKLVLVLMELYHTNKITKREISLVIT